MQDNNSFSIGLASSSSARSKDEASYRLYGLLGGLSGLFMESVLYPLNTIMTRMMTNTQESITLLAQTKTMYKQEGLSSYFRGYNCVLIGSFASSALYFYLYEKFKHTLIHRDILSKDIAPFIAGFTVGFATNLIDLPFSVVNTRMQLKPGEYNYKHFFDGVKQIIKKEGFTKLYLGAPMFFLDATVHLGLTFGFYELFYRALQPIFPSDKDINLPVSIASSVSAAALTGLLTNPFDVIVTRQQAMNTEIHGSSNVTKLVKNIYKNEGFKGFMKGATGNVPMSALGALVLFPTYEVLKGTFNGDLSAE